MKGQSLQCIAFPGAYAQVWVTMGDQHDDMDQLPDAAAPARRRHWSRILLGVFGVIAVLLAIVWFSRERIADNLIASQLESYGVPATYKIEQIGPSEQVLTDIVIGDPQRPDLTVDRAEISILQRFGWPRIERVKIVRPRLFGSFQNGTLSFGKLDPLLFDKTSKEPFKLPGFDLVLEDGRGLLETDFGPVGLKAEGKGGLRNGFSGYLAANAPELAGQGCAANHTTFFGRISIAHARPKIEGPARLQSLLCEEQGISLRNAALGIAARADETFGDIDSTFDLRSGAGRFGGVTLTGVNGSGDFSLTKGAVNTRYNVVMRGLHSPFAASPVLTGKGHLRGEPGDGRYEWNGDWEGNGVRLGSQIDDTLAGLAGSGEGTLLAPIVQQMRAALQREGRGSRLVAETVLRKTPDSLNLVMPQATLRGGSGATLMALSRIQYSRRGTAPGRLLGSFSTGGRGLPQMTGRMEQESGGKAVLRMTMPEYRAGTSSLAVPELVLVQNAQGMLGFSGSVRANGPLPGGQTQGLVLPVSGNWSQAFGLALWRECADIRFDQLELGGARFEKRGVILCPQRGSAIVRSDRSGTRIAAGTTGLDLAGHLGDSPVRVRSGALGFAVPGTLAARDLDVRLGPPDTESRFLLSRLDARIGKDISGQFTNADVKLAAVPLDLFGAQGDWRYENGRLLLANAQLQVEDRLKPGRFEPLTAQGADLTLNNNIIVANALMQNPKSGRDVMRVAVTHDLGSASGYADLNVGNLVFDDQLQPDMLTGLALGVVANAKGTVTGTGRIDWNPVGVTSTGRFSTKALDLAAAFGPVQGASGTIVFTDLLGMVTAPNQQLNIAAINPGIEVRDGVLTYDMKPNFVLDIHGARWPFMDGTLTLEPTRMRLGEAETRRYTLTVDGLDAAVFVQRMELGNIMATGKFDGTLPLVFDEDGGRIEGGKLASRAPGGNVSYLGELTYKDLSAMGNFAFDALRSIDYGDMQIDMNGSLAGEILTRVSFDGLSQGQGASKNFITKQVAKLPIHFNVNIKAPFFSLFGSFKSLYDPTLVPDPAKLGLIGAKKPQIKVVQRPVSETMR